MAASPVRKEPGGRGGLSSCPVLFRPSAPGGAVPSPPPRTQAGPAPRPAVPRRPAAPGHLRATRSGTPRRPAPAPAPAGRPAPRTRSVSSTALAHRATPLCLRRQTPDRAARAVPGEGKRVGRQQRLEVGLRQTVARGEFGQRARVVRRPQVHARRNHFVQGINGVARLPATASICACAPPAPNSAAALSLRLRVSSPCRETTSRSAK